MQGRTPDRIEQLACRTEFDAESAGFIQAVHMFFLATVDHNGRPTVSYKGGDPGFVKILDSTTLVFPSFGRLCVGFAFSRAIATRRRYG